MIINKQVGTAAKNGYYGSLVPMVRDAFLSSELVRIDCQGLERSDYKKIGCKLRVYCVLYFLKHTIILYSYIYDSTSSLFLIFKRSAIITFGMVRLGWNMEEKCSLLYSELMLKIFTSVFCFKCKTYKASIALFFLSCRILYASWWLLLSFISYTKLEEVIRVKY